MTAAGVSCPNCSNTIEPGLRFCTNCGNPAPALCSTCGAPITGTQKFCVGCGIPVNAQAANAPTPAVVQQHPLEAQPTFAPVPPPSVPGPEQAGSTPPRKSRLLPILAMVAAVVLALTATGVAAAVVLGGDDAPATADATATDPAGAASTPADDAGSGATASASTDAESAEPAATETPEPELATCWDGSSAERVRDCSSPTGIRGLRWVFPSIADADTCYPGGASRYERPTMRTCFDYLADGTQIKFNYSEWADLDLALDHYDSTSYRKGPWAGGLTRWLIISRDQDFKAALMYPGKQFSVTIYAPTESARDRAIVDLLRVRKLAELSGTPA